MSKTTSDTSEFQLNSNSKNKFNNKNYKRKRNYDKGQTLFSGTTLTKKTFFNSYNRVASQYESQYVSTRIQKPVAGTKNLLNLTDLEGDNIKGAQIWYLNNIVAGTENWQRVGIHTMIQHISANLSLTYYSSNTADLKAGSSPSPQICTLIYFVDQQANNKMFDDVSSLLQDINADGSVSTTVLSNKNVANVSRYKILSKKTFTVSIPTQYQCTSASNMTLDNYISKSKNPKMQKYLQRATYSDTTPLNGIPSTTNAYYLLFLSSVELATIENNVVTPSKCMCIEGTVETSFKTVEINVKKTK